MQSTKLKLKSREMTTKLTVPRTQYQLSVTIPDGSKDSNINIKANLGMVLFQISWQVHEVNILLWFLQAASHSNLFLSIRPITDVRVELVLPTTILLAHG